MKLRWVRGSQLSVVALLAAGWIGCTPSGADKVEILDDSVMATYVDSTLELSPLVYSLGGETLNDRCPVRLVRLNRRLPAIYVNTHPVGFC
jgi:hypothetical protein